jgi:hypothetical protein
MMTNRQRIGLLASYGAPDPEIEELLAYNRNAFDRQGVDTPPVLPLPAEPHVAAWERSALEAAEGGAFAPPLGSAAVLDPGGHQPDGGLSGGSPAAP